MVIRVKRVGSLHCEAGGEDSEALEVEDEAR